MPYIGICHQYWIIHRNGAGAVRNNGLITRKMPFRTALSPISKFVRSNAHLPSSIVHRPTSPEGGRQYPQLVAVLGDGAAGDADALVPKVGHDVFVGHRGGFVED